MRDANDSEQFRQRLKNKYDFFLVCPVPSLVSVLSTIAFVAFLKIVNILLGGAKQKSRALQ